MADTEVIEAMHYKPEIAALIEMRWPLEKKTLRLALNPFSVQEITKYLIGLEYNNKFTHQEKAKLFPAVVYALDLLESEGKIVYAGLSSSNERIYASSEIIKNEDYMKSLIELGVIAKPEEESAVPTEPPVKAATGTEGSNIKKVASTSCT